MRGASGLNVMVAGLTAAGKTMHSRILAERMGLRYESASGRLLDLLGENAAIVSDFWVTEEGRGARERQDLMARVDEELAGLAGTESGIVFDTFGLPWVSRARAFRIRIDSTLTSRAWKAMVSHRHGAELHRELGRAFARGEEAEVDAIVSMAGQTSGSASGDGYSDAEMSELVREKDDESRRYFRGRYGFDIYSGSDVFDLVLDVSDLVSAPDLASCSASIRRADALIGPAVAWALKPSRRRADLFRAAASSDPGVVLVCPPPLR